MTTEPRDPLHTLATTPTEEAMGRLHTRLERTAADAGLLDVAYRTVPTPVGDLLLAATEAGLVRVAYVPVGEEEVLDELARRLSPRVLRSPGRLDPAARQLEEYFTGRRRVFEMPLDLSLAARFGRAVLEQLTAIDYGTTATYATVAARAGRPRAVRAVGTACARNPLPVVVPCHRVVRSDGSVGGYVGGAAAKQALLTLESGSTRATVRP